MPNFVSACKCCKSCIALVTEEQLRNILTEDQLRNILKKLDTNKDGLLSRKEVAAALKKHGLHFTSWKAICAVHRVDRDSDGYIDPDEMKEFVKLVLEKWAVNLVR